MKQFLKLKKLLRRRNQKWFYQAPKNIKNKGAASNFWQVFDKSDLNSLCGLDLTT